MRLDVAVFTILHTALLNPNLDPRKKQCPMPNPNNDCYDPKPNPNLSHRHIGSALRLDTETSIQMKIL